MLRLLLFPAVVKVFVRVLHNHRGVKTLKELLKLSVLLLSSVSRLFVYKGVVIDVSHFNINLLKAWKIALELLCKEIFIEILSFLGRSLVLSFKNAPCKDRLEVLEVGSWFDLEDIARNVAVLPRLTNKVDWQLVHTDFEVIEVFEFFLSIAYFLCLIDNVEHEAVGVNLINTHEDVGNSRNVAVF